MEEEHLQRYIEYLIIELAAETHRLASATSDDQGLTYDRPAMKQDPKPHDNNQITITTNSHLLPQIPDPPSCTFG